MVRNRMGTEQKLNGNKIREKETEEKRMGNKQKKRKLIVNQNRI